MADGPLSQKGRRDNPVTLRCCRCGKTPEELDEYREGALVEGTTAEQFARENEGTLNRETGLFACTPCYIAMGQPSRPYPGPGWTP